MLLYQTQLKFSEELTKESLIEAIIKWNDESFYQVNRIPNINWDGKSKHIDAGAEGLSLKLDEYRNENIIAMRYEKNADGVLWKTDVVANFNERKLAIILDRTFDPNEITNRRDFSAPKIAEYLVNTGCILDDGQLPVKCTPTKIGNDVEGFITSLKKCEMGNRLPVILVAEMRKGYLNVKRLAERVRGVAHVVAVTNKESVAEIYEQNNVRFDIPCWIGFYFPENNGEVVKSHECYDFQPEREHMDFAVNTVLNYVNGLQYTSLYYYNNVKSSLLSDRLEARSQELDDMIAEFGDENDSLLIEKKYLEDENEELQKKVYELQETIKQLTTENIRWQQQQYNRNNASKPLLFYGNMGDVFPDEIKEMVLDAIEKGKAHWQDKYVRRVDVLDDILKNNENPHNIKKRVDTLNNALRGYKRPSEVEGPLKTLGFEKGEDRKNHLIFNYGGNPKYSATLACTPSDHRAGENAAHIIEKTCY